MSPIDSARRALQNMYHIIGGLWVLPMAKWLKRSALTHRAQVRSHAQKSFFISFPKFIKIFAYPCFYAENTMAILFFHENFWKNRKYIFFVFFKSFHERIITPSCSSHKNMGIQKFS